MQAANALAIGFLLEQPGERHIIGIWAGYGHAWRATHTYREEQARYKVNGHFSRVNMASDRIFRILFVT